MIRPVTSRRDLGRFIDLPYRLHRDDPNWVPPLRLGEWERFNPKKNPFYQHARMELFLAERDGQVVGRVAAIDDDNHNATHGDNLAFFGFFEAADEGVARALLEHVEGWARKLGRSAVRGPTNPSMNDSFGLQIDAFDTPPYVLMPYNPPEYVGFVEAAGYGKAKDVYAWFFDHHSARTDRLAQLAARVGRRTPFRVRALDLKRFRDEVELVKRLYNDVWEKNWGFVRYTDAETERLAEDLRFIIDPEIVVFLELHGETVGLAVALPDANQVLRRIRGGRLLPFGFIHYLRRRKIINQARLPLLGVVKEHRHKGLELVLMHEVAKRSLARGYLKGECSWILEDNEPMNRGIEAAGATLYKTYRLYQKNL